MCVLLYFYYGLQKLFMLINQPINVKFLKKIKLYILEQFY